MDYQPYYRKAYHDFQSAREHLRSITSTDSIIGMANEFKDSQRPKTIYTNLLRKGKAFKDASIDLLKAQETMVLLANSVLNFVKRPIEDRLAAFMDIDIEGLNYGRIYVDPEQPDIPWVQGNNEQPWPPGVTYVS